jgi:hypothetical protein
VRATPRGALQKAKDLSPAEAAAVFEALAEQARRDDDPGDEASALGRTFDWVGARPELYVQLITLLGSLPDRDLPPSVAPRILRLAPGEEQAQAARGGCCSAGRRAPGATPLRRRPPRP